VANSDPGTTIKPVKVGVIGCGNIFAQYVEGLRMYRILDLVACADIDLAVATVKAKEHAIPHAESVETLLADPEIEIVVNLTVPKTHAQVSLAIIEAGKHVYSEKPLAITREDASAMIDAAQRKGVLVGCAPDTFLGGGLQTSRKLIDDGWIGFPVAATAFFAGHGPEAWHPNPFFFYQTGGGPMLDLGPYYITALISLLGPVKRAVASARISFPERIATSEQHFGKHIPVEVPTHVAGVLDFASGPVASLITSFDVWSHHLPRIEIYGSEGTLSVPDPNTFGGPVLVRRAGAKDWSEIPLSHDDSMVRGVGPADMAYALRTGRNHRASGALAFHALDVMFSLIESSEREAHIAIQSTCEQPAAIPTGLLHGTLD
jgi:predicted dehydrogenase